MGERIKEIKESAVSLGDLVRYLTDARDLAMAGEMVQMRDKLNYAKQAWNAFRIDCQTICDEIQGGEQ